MIVFINTVLTILLDIFVLWLLYKFVVFLIAPFKRNKRKSKKHSPKVPVLVWETNSVIESATELAIEPPQKPIPAPTTSQATKVSYQIRRLKVPYSEKDSAKQFGAKWDPHNKTWYITEQQSIMDMYFNGWYDLSPECGQGTCEKCEQYSLHFLDIEIHDNYHCYKCKKPMGILLIFFPYEEDWNSDFRDMRPLESEFANRRPKDLIPFAKQYDVLLAPSQKKSVSEFCYHICPHCHSLQGDYYIVTDMHQDTKAIIEFRASYCAACKQWEKIW